MHVIECILKDDPLKKQNFVIHESLQRLGVDNVQALGHNGSSLSQISYEFNRLKSVLK